MSQSDKTLSDAINGSIVSGTPTTHLVEYPNGDVESVEKGSLHGSVCSLSEIDPDNPINARGRAFDEDKYDGDGIDVQLQIKPQGDRLAGKITVGGRVDEVKIQESTLGKALVAIETDIVSDQGQSDQQNSITARKQQSSQIDQSNLSLSREVADHLYGLYEDTLESRVRANVVSEFSDQFTSTSIEVSDNGWVVGDTYLVTFDGAENYLVDDTDVYKVTNGTTVKTDGENQAVGLNFDTTPFDSITVNGDEFTLSSKEQRFLATVQFLSHPKRYLDIETFETEVYEAIETAKGESFDRSMIEDITRSVRVSHFVDPVSGLLHRHDIDKHVLRSTFKISRWVVDELDYSSFDHAGLAELAYREEEFRNAMQDVFFDGTENNDDERWEQINSRHGDAPCPPEVQRKLRAKYGSN